MDVDPTKIRAIMVGGLQRSGTTLIGRLLATHPSVTGLAGTPTPEDEGQFVQTVYPTDHDMGRILGIRTGQLVRWAYSPDAHWTEEHAQTGSNLGHRLLSDWRPYWEKPAASTFVEKSPSNMLRTRFHQSVFEECDVVIVVRHPVTQALAVRKWSAHHQKIGLDFTSIIDHWFQAMDTLRADLPYLRRATIIPYEALTRAPADTMNTVFESLHLAPHATDTSNVRSSGRYERYWRRMASPQLHPFEPIVPLAKRRSIVPRTLERIVVPAVGSRTVRKVRQTFGDRAREYGYDIEDLATSTRWRLPQRVQTHIHMRLALDNGIASMAGELAAPRTDETPA